MNSTYCFIVNGNEVVEGDNIETYGSLPQLRAGKYDKWYLAPDEDYATSKEKDYWQDMAWRDSEEFVMLLGGAEAVMGYWLRGETVEDVIDQIMSERCEWGDVHYVDSMSVYIMKQHPNLSWEDVYIDDSDEPIEDDVVCPDDADDDMIEHMEDTNTARALARGWWELCRDLGYEPEVAYRAN